MSFFFENQNNKVEPPRKRMMDVRVPAASAGINKRNASHFSFSKGIPHSAPRRGMDGVKTGFIPEHQNFTSPYAQRLLEMRGLQNAKQVKPVRRVSFTLPFSFLKNFRSFRFIQLTPNRLVYGSIMSGVAFGMVSLGLIENTFQSNAAAEAAPKVETISLQTANYNAEKDVFTQYFSDAADAEYQAGVRDLVKGHPIEEMLPYIFEKDRVTAAFLIGIAKKESNWGKRRPVLDGQDCFNYWGYRGQRRLMGSGGHTCFNSRKDAVDTVAKRLETLIGSERLNTPAKLIVWKCGFSCEGHGRESVEKWIADVDAYYSEMMALESENTEIEDIPDEQN